MKKRMTLLIALVVAILAVSAAGSLAYFSKEATATNVITAGNVSFEIHELTDGDKPFPAEGVTVMPGSTVKKVVTVENTGDHPIFFRIKLTKAVQNSELPAEEQLLLDINTEDWEYKDGYYYYKKEIAAGAVTEPLFTTVSVDGPSVDNKYMGKTFLLTVDGYCVQSENNAANPLDALGWE